NDAGGRGRLGAAVDGPGAGFLRADGEIGDEIEQLIAGADQPVEARFLKAQRVEEILALLARQGRDFRLDLGRDHDRNGAFLFGALEDLFGKTIAVPGRAFLDVADVEDRL